MKLQQSAMPVPIQPEQEIEIAHVTSNHSLYINYSSIIHSSCDGEMAETENCTPDNCGETGECVGDHCDGGSGGNISLTISS